LQELGRNSDYYHAGRSAEARAEVHERFLSNGIEIVVATNAFGMGVDKPDIRFIIHYAHPGSIDAYYQEIGRGGRDGERCDCILLFSRFDRKVQEQFIVNSTPSSQMIEECLTQIVQMTNRSGEVALKRSFFEGYSIELFELEKAGLLNRRPVMGGGASVYLSRSFDRALDRCSPEQREVLEALDRHLDLSVKGYAAMVDMNEFRCDYFPDADMFSLEQTLLTMNEGGILAYRPSERRICYKVATVSFGNSIRRKIEESVSLRRDFKMKRLKMMTEYGTLHSCLREYLLNALADSTQGTRCGFCDNCL
jgi:ATP-dependent DNA helicase RecQ